MHPTSSLPPVDERGQCTACGRFPNDGEWCAECDGWPDYESGPGRSNGGGQSLAAPALSSDSGRALRTLSVCVRWLAPMFLGFILGTGWGYGNGFLEGWVVGWDKSFPVKEARK